MSLAAGVTNLDLCGNGVSHKPVSNQEAWYKLGSNQTIICVTTQFFPITLRSSICRILCIYTVHRPSKMRWFKKSNQVNPEEQKRKNEEFKQIISSVKVK